jgi:hypothetical protein
MRIAADQLDDAARDLFTEFTVAPEDIFGDDVHIPDTGEEGVADNGDIFDQAAGGCKGSPAIASSSLTFRCELPAPI